MPSPDEASPFLRNMREVIRVRHYSIRTKETYVQWVKRFIVFHGKRHHLRWERQRSLHS